MKPLQPLRLSAIITFGFVATLALAAGMWWKDRARLVHEMERLRWQMSYPVHPSGQPNNFGDETQLVEWEGGGGTGLPTLSDGSGDPSYCRGA
jgi:hypothetical protein